MNCEEDRKSEGFLSAASIPLCEKAKLHSRWQGLNPNSVLQSCLGLFLGFPGGSMVKNPPANAGDMGSITGSGISPGEGNGNPL